MKTSIIVSDNVVYQNEVPYFELNLSSCNIPSNVRALQFNGNNGWIEFSSDNVGNIPQNEEITSLPSWATSAISLWTNADNSAKNPPSPTQQQLIQICKLQALILLQSTDWATLSDVTIGNPKLTNQNEFLSYRSVIRGLAVNPVENPNWPTIPTETWE